MRKGRRLGRLLVFMGLGLWIPELYMAWVLLGTLLTPIRAANGQLAQVHVHLNLTAWLAAIGWMLLAWLLIGWGVRLMLRKPDN